MKYVGNVMKDIEEFMTDEMVRKALRENYGYPELYLEYISPKFAIEELATCICEAEPDCDCTYPHHEVDLPNGQIIKRDGEIGTLYCLFYELVHTYGLDPQEVNKMSADEKAVKWSELSGHKLSDEFWKKFLKKEKKKFIKMGFTALEDF